MHYARLMRRGSVDIVLTNYDKPPKYSSLQNYLESSFLKCDIESCWEWQRSFKVFGYGNAWWEGKHHIAHRLVYQFYVGEIPKGLNVCHKCDNPKCVNPHHLFLGSYLDNNRDRKNKARNANTHGERNPFAKLTETNVLDIYKRLKNGEKGKHIAKIYSVSAHTISKIKHGVNWSYLKEMQNAISERSQGQD